MDNKILKQGLATCIYGPRGDYGLEGYQLNDVYPYQIKETEEGTIYYKVFPAGLDYGETCCKRVFNKYFKEITNEKLIQKEIYN